MKKIAIDLDGVIFDSENLYRVYSEIYDTDIFEENNIIDNTKRTFQERYNWQEEISKEFYQKYSKEVLESSNIMPGALIVLEKLKGKFELIIVTSRNDKELEYAKEKLNLDVKYFNNQNTKIDLYINELVDYIIDDDINICKNAATKQIKTIYFKNNAEPYIEESKYLKTVNNWGEIYKYLMLKSK